MTSKKEDKILKNGRQMVAAIDFGTTYSGYAYCRLSDYNANTVDPKILGYNWNAGAFLNYKAPTCVLFKPDKTFHSFGYDAIDYYHNNPERKKLQDWYYFEHFKMMLYLEKELTTEMYLEETIQVKEKERKKKMLAVDVFKAVIAYFKWHLLKEMKSPVLSDEAIQWVITVPAIWDLKARTFMREAAKEAGITNDQLILALEPEAASIYCRRVPVSVETIGPGRKVIASMYEGTKYVVVDQGGGTTDIAVHEITGLDTLKEIHQACGGHWGGITVNKEFYDFLIEIFGADVIDAIKEETPNSYFSLLHGFEHSKTSFKVEDLEDPDGRKTIRIPVDWIEKYNKMETRSLGDSIKKSNFKGQVTIKSDRMMLKHTLYKTFFTYSIDHVIEELENLFRKKELDGVKILLAVGGHSASTVLTEAIKTAFPNLSILVPREPGMVVLKGAVLLGFEPELITSRISRFTYGISIRRPFKEGVDPKYKKRELADDYVDNVFDKHVEIGQVVKVGELAYLPEHDYVPAYKDQKGVDFQFYQSLSTNPKYVTDKDCELIGSLYFELTEGMSAKNEMTLKINASGTELVALVTEKATGKKTKGYFRLLKKYGGNEK